MKTKTLRSLNLGQTFQDSLGQTFRLVRLVAAPGSHTRCLREVVCVASPHDHKLTPITRAFFTVPGTTLYLPGNQPIRPDL